MLRSVGSTQVDPFFEDLLRPFNNLRFLRAFDLDLYIYKYCSYSILYHIMNARIIFTYIVEKDSGVDMGVKG